MEYTLYIIKTESPQVRILSGSDHCKCNSWVKNISCKAQSFGSLRGMLRSYFWI